MKGEKRLIDALQAGWGFCSLRFNNNQTQRHSLCVGTPENNGWTVHKVSADVSKEDFLSALLDEAGVPKDFA